MVSSELKQILDKLEDHELRLKSLEFIDKPPNKQKPNDKVSSANSNALILSIVNKIGDCERNEEIKRNVLDKVGQEGKILLCFYTSYKYFKNAWLTTGDIEKITSELGVKIDIRNVTKKIKVLRRYLESSAVRRRGVATPYRLNRKGLMEFEEIIHG